MVYYPILASEMTKRGITKKSLAAVAGISYRAIFDKLSGRVPFTWPEVCKIESALFSDIDKDTLFAQADPVLVSEPRDSA